MDAGQIEALLQQQAHFLQQTMEQPTNAHTQAMNAMAEMVRSLQSDVRAAAECRFQTKENEFMTSCLLDVAQLLRQSRGVRELAIPNDSILVPKDPYFVECIEWIENDMGPEDQLFALQEKDF